jgi:hypothetical protein
MKTPYDEVNAKEIRALVAGAVAELKPDQQIAVLYRHLYGEPFSRIAKRMTGRRSGKPVCPARANVIYRESLNDLRHRLNKIGIDYSILNELGHSR